LRTIPTGSRNSLPPNLFNTNSKGQIRGGSYTFLLTVYQHRSYQNPSLALPFWR